MCCPRRCTTINADKVPLHIRAGRMSDPCIPPYTSIVAHRIAEYRTVEYLAYAASHLHMLPPGSSGPPSIISSFTSSVVPLFHGAFHEQCHPSINSCLEHVPYILLPMLLPVMSESAPSRRSCGGPRPRLTSPPHLPDESVHPCELERNGNAASSLFLFCTMRRKKAMMGSSRVVVRSVVVGVVISIVAGLHVSVVAVAVACIVGDRQRLHCTSGARVRTSSRAASNVSWSFASRRPRRAHSPIIPSAVEAPIKWSRRRHSELELYVVSCFGRHVEKRQ